MRYKCSRRLVAILCTLAGPGVAAALEPSPEPVFADGRDRWSLVERKLLNRQLARQVGDRPGSVGRDPQGLVWAVDLSIGSQQPTPWGDLQTRFHGWFVADIYVGFALLDGVELNLNLIALNPSASDGYRVSSHIAAGVNAHLFYTFEDLWGRPVRLDAVIHDLDLVTFARGLLIEEIPLEGILLAARWGALELQLTYAGQVFWSDDFIGASLYVWDRSLALHLTQWTISPPFEEGVVVAWSDNLHPFYLGISGEVGGRGPVRGVAEIQVLAAPTGAVPAVLGRGDARVLDWGPLTLHLGSQIRFYARGFGPQPNTEFSAVVYAVPSREDLYVTNSFEFLDRSRYYRQLSFTQMLEARFEVRSGWRLVLDLEVWSRRIDDPNETRIVRTLTAGRIPGWVHQAYYRFGVEARPNSWLRLRALLTNKQVASRTEINEPVGIRFQTLHVAIFEIEARL